MAPTCGPNLLWLGARLRRKGGQVRLEGAYDEQYVPDLVLSGLDSLPRAATTRQNLLSGRRTGRQTGETLSSVTSARRVTRAGEVEEPRRVWCRP